LLSNEGFLSCFLLMASLSLWGSFIWYWLFCFLLSWEPSHQHSDDNKTAPAHQFIHNGTPLVSLSHMCCHCSVATWDLPYHHMMLFSLLWHWESSHQCGHCDLICHLPAHCLTVQ
jgi:hypothetical protein